MVSRAGSAGGARHNARERALTDGEFEELAAFCASLAVFYSKAKNEPRHRVDYTRRKYVSPIRGGEANVTYKEFSTIAGEPALWSEKAPK